MAKFHYKAKMAFNHLHLDVIMIQNPFPILMFCRNSLKKKYTDLLLSRQTYSINFVWIVNLLTIPTTRWQCCFSTHFEAHQSRRFDVEKHTSWRKAFILCKIATFIYFICHSLLYPSISASRLEFGEAFHRSRAETSLKSIDADSRFSVSISSASQENKAKNLSFTRISKTHSLFNTAETSKWSAFGCVSSCVMMCRERLFCTAWKVFRGKNGESLEMLRKHTDWCGKSH